MARSTTPLLATVLDQTSSSQRQGSDLPVSLGTGLAASMEVTAPSHNRWSGSAWLFVRGSGSNSALASAGQLGGAQLGARIAYDLGSGLAIAGRASSPLRETRGAETAVGLEWSPVTGTPLRIAIERRAAIGSQGRNAWAAYIAGGFWKEGLPWNLVADGYGQAGVVGAGRRDLFVDGAVRIMRPVAIAGKARLDLGAGMWGAAQPGVSRLDIGPHFGVRFPLGSVNASTSIDARLRMAGEARPGSGVALTLAADF